MTSETLDLVIAGRAHTPGPPVAIRNPYSGDEVGRTYAAGAVELDAAAAASVRGFEAWRREPSHRRAAVLAAVAQGLREGREAFARSITSEAGKPIRDARVEAERAAHVFTLASEEAKRVTGEFLPLDLFPGSEGRTALVRRVPAGPVLGITPFNFPLNLVAHKAAPALALGCSIVVKPAPQTPLTALRLAALARAAGLPGDVFQVVPTTNELAGSLVEDERFRVLSFTGSPGVGWALKARAGRKRVLLELGGNAAVIVHRDADLEAAVRRATVGGMSYSGQVCISVQRVYAQREIFDGFLASLVEAVAGLVVGDPFEEATQISALIRPGEAERVATWVSEAQAGGARVVTGGRVLPTPGGRAYAPTIVTGTRPGMRVVDEEVFGPLIVVEPYDDVEGAFDAVNAGRFGLQAGLYTNDLGIVQRAFERLEVGAVLVNEVPTYRADHMPYGGVKESGLGREGVRYAMEEMSERRVLVLPAPPAREPEGVP